MKKDSKVQWEEFEMCKCWKFEWDGVRLKRGFFDFAKCKKCGCWKWFSEDMKVNNISSGNNGEVS